MKKLVYAVLVALVVIALVMMGSGLAQAGGTQRATPPQIEVYGLPYPAGGEPAACAGQDGCGTMCFYISENAVENQYELSCIGWIFE